jgi:hypothetical protein
MASSKVTLQRSQHLRPFQASWQPHYINSPRSFHTSHCPIQLKHERSAPTQQLPLEHIYLVKAQDLFRRSSWRPYSFSTQTQQHSFDLPRCNQPPHLVEARDPCDRCIERPCTVHNTEVRDHPLARCSAIYLFNRSISPSRHGDSTTLLGWHYPTKRWWWSWV